MHRFATIQFLCAAALAACAAPTDSPAPPPQAPAAQPGDDSARLPIEGAALPSDQGAAATPQPEAHAAAADTRLELDEALRLALAYSPEAEAARARLSGVRARGEGAGSWTEPTLYAGVEALPFSSPREEEEWLVGISFALPAPGAGRAERSVAEAEGSLAEAALRRTLREVDARVRAAFGGALAAQRAAELTGEVLALHEHRLAMAVEEHGAGILSEDARIAVRLKQVRAQAVAAQAEDTAGLRRAELDLLLPPAARARALGGDLDTALALPELEALLARIEELPRAQEAAAETRLAQLRAELAAARRIPEVQFDLAWRERGDGRESLDAVVGIGLPFGGRRAAEADGTLHEAAAAGARARMRWREVRAELLASHAEARAAARRLATLEEELRPLQDRRVELTAARVASGDANQREGVDTRLAAALLDLEALEARAALHQAWSRLRPFLVAGD